MDTLVWQHPPLFMEQFTAALDDTELADWILNESDPCLESILIANLVSSLPEEMSGVRRFT
jgi:hypothetical protein